MMVASERIASSSEASDFLAIEYDTTGSSTFTALLEDHEVWNGVHDLTGDASLGFDGNTVSTSTGPLALPTTANNNPNLQIRIRARISATTEDMFLDSLSVEGVPEPSRAVLCGIGLAALILVRRRLP